MSDKIRYIRQPSAESAGEAPGRGRLKGRRILVVGGGQRTFDAAIDPVGNGRAMSLLFAREGAHVAVADVNRASADDTVQRVLAEQGRAFSIQADIAREEDVNRMIDEAIYGLGGLDGMVLNVGIGVGALGLDGVNLKEWNDTFAVNLTGPMLCCRKALKHIADGSSIVFISSIAALRSGSRLIAYDASKAALGGLMRNVAKEGSRRGVRANIIYPGLVDTPLGRPAHQRRAAVAKRRRRAVRADGDRVGNRLCGAVLHLRRERLRQRAGAGGRQRNLRAVRAGSGENISFAGGAIQAINLLQTSLRTKHTLLFSLRYRLLSPPGPSFPSATRRIGKTKKCDRFVHCCAGRRSGSDAVCHRSSPSPPPACRRPALKARPLFFLHKLSNRVRGRWSAEGVGRRVSLLRSSETSPRLLPR